MLYHSLRYTLGFPVEDVFLPKLGGGADWCVIRLQREARVDVAGLLDAAIAQPGGSQAKYIVVVDHDVDARDSDLLIWALSYRVRPDVDIVRAGRTLRVDGPVRGRRPGAGEKQRVLIDATLKGPYPPVALPRRDFMERALAIWREQPGLPEPRLRAPWHGYALGAWSEQDQALADLMLDGDYRAVGRISATAQETQD